MELSYEETMQRIEKYEKTFVNRTYCREKRFPFRVHVYKGENQIIVVPLITTIVGYSAEMAWHRKITDLENPILLGETILQAIQHIKDSPVDARTEDERYEDSVLKKLTHCKSYSEFDRKYLYCSVIFNNDETLLIYPCGHNEKKEVYSGEKNQKLLQFNDMTENIGKAVLQSFLEMQLFYGKKKASNKC